MSGLIGNKCSSESSSAVTNQTCGIWLAEVCGNFLKISNNDILNSKVIDENSSKVAKADCKSLEKFDFSLVKD